MKKLLSVLLASAMMLSLAACGGGDKPQGGQTSQQPSSGGQSSSQQGGSGTPADPMQELIDAAKAEGELVVYGSCEEDYLSAACQKFEQLYGIKTTFQRLSTGEVQAKIEEENGNPSADVWFGGTTDPYNVVAAEGLLEPYAAINASQSPRTCTSTPTICGTASTPASWALWSTRTSWTVWAWRPLRIGPTCSSPSMRA